MGVAQIMVQCGDNEGFITRLLGCKEVRGWDQIE